jgi:glutathione S-transferase
VVIGNKNYSSWSLRGWLMARIAGIEFEEIVVPLDLPETQASIRKHSPSGKVPVLLHRGLAIWESLAIAEYLNDLKPELPCGQPRPRRAAHARSISAEMHAGFAELRNNMPMNIRAAYPGKGMTPARARRHRAHHRPVARLPQALWRAFPRMTASCSAPSARPTPCMPR